MCRASAASAFEDTATCLEELRPRVVCARHSCFQHIRLLRFSFPNDFPNWHIKPGTNALNGRELKVLSAAFNGSVIGTMHADVIREAFLAVALSLAASTHRVANSLL